MLTILIKLSTFQFNLFKEDGFEIERAKDTCCKFPNVPRISFATLSYHSAFSKFNI